MKKIEVKNCTDCPFIYWDVDFDQDYIGAMCSLSYNLGVAPYSSFGGCIESFDSDYSGSTNKVSTPEWCPLRKKDYEIKLKL